MADRKRAVYLHAALETLLKTQREKLYSHFDWFIYLQYCLNFLTYIICFNYCKKNLSFKNILPTEPFLDKALVSEIKS